MRWVKRIAIVLLVLALITGAGFVIWGLTPQGPAPAAMAAMQSDANVKVEQGDWITFRPVGQQPKAGFVFYPGGHVDPRSYAVTAHAIAGQGYLVAIAPMPLNLAILDGEKATEVIKANPEIKDWAIGGHSLGGVMAAQYAYRYPDRVKGLALWASYPMSGNSLAGHNLAVTSAYGTEDPGRTQIEASRPLLPSSTKWVVIDGGNHGQFGDYGPQPGDNPAKISREEQQAQAVQATVDLLKAMQP